MGFVYNSDYFPVQHKQVYPFSGDAVFSARYELNFQLAVRWIWGHRGSVWRATSSGPLHLFWNLGIGL